MSKPHSFFEKFWKKPDGSQGLWQTPNVPLLGWFVCMVLVHITEGHLKTGLQFLGSAFLFTWAYLEITTGVSYFRRVLGLAVLLWTVIKHF
jgi:hypothetical protein